MDRYFLEVNQDGKTKCYHINAKSKNEAKTTFLSLFPKYEIISVKRILKSSDVSNDTVISFEYDISRMGNQ